MREQQKKEGIQIDSSSWQKKLSVAINRFLDSDNSTKEGFIDILWNSAIIDRIAPTDPEVITLRKSEGRSVFEDGRENPELYWRIMYAAAGCIENIRMSTSLICSPDNYVAGIYPELYRLSSANALRVIYPDLQQRAIDITGDIISRAKREIVKMTGDSGSLDGHPLRYGAEGEWQGIKVKVKGFAGDGTVSFQAENLDDHMNIYVNSENNGFVLPWTIDPKMFSLPVKD